MHGADEPGHRLHRRRALRQRHGETVAYIDERGSANRQVYDDDATQILDWLPEASIDPIDLLYPDPWPKRRHWKRRFVCRANLDRFARVLRPGGAFRFASDIDGYVNWTLVALPRHPPSMDPPATPATGGRPSRLARHALRGQGAARGQDGPPIWLFARGCYPFYIWM